MVADGMIGLSVLVEIKDGKCRITAGEIFLSRQRELGRLWKTTG